MASKKALFDADDEDDVNTLNINEDYAKHYSTWRAKEEKQKLETRFGIEVGESSSSDSEEEDEDAQLLTGDVDKQWLRTWAAVKKNDPRIYDPNYKFFEDAPQIPEDSDSSSAESDDRPAKKKKKEQAKTEKKTKKEEHKPMYMKEYERKLITEKGGVLSESEDDDEAEERMKSQTYAEQQDALKKSLKMALADMSSEDEDEDLLKQKVKTREEKEEEEEEYLLFLKGHKKAGELKKDKAIAEELAPLKDFLSRPDLDENEKTLWNYNLGRNYRSKTKLESQDWYQEQMAQLQADDEVDEAERKYDFRFEEPDQDYIKTYERNPQDTLRQKDNKRAHKRQEIKDRKRQEKEQLQEEIRQLKNLKRKEIMDKLDQLKEVTGNPDIAFTSKDIEDEFDPAAHDQLMQKYFGKDFYEENEDEKPVFKDDLVDDDFEDEDWDSWEVGGDRKKSSSQDPNEDPGEGTSAGPHTEDQTDEGDFNMDADFDPSQASYTSGKKKKKKSKFRQLLEKEKPTFEEVCQKYQGSDHPFGDYLDQYFKLDCEDIIAGDVKCRFHYRKTVPNDYGLSVEEVLVCPDRELNAWAPLKKICQFRNKDDEMYEVRKFKKAKKLRKKYNILPSLKEEISETPEEFGRRNERDEDDDEANSEDTEESSAAEVDSSSPKKKKKTNNSSTHSDADQSAKKKKKRKRTAENTGNQSADLESASPKKKKGKLESKVTVKMESVSPKKKKGKLESKEVKVEMETLKKKIMKPKRESEVEATNSAKGLKSRLVQKKDKGKKLKTGAPVPKKKANKKGGDDAENSPAKKTDNKNTASNKKEKRKLKLKQKKKGKGKQQGYSVGDMSSQSRLLALGIDPKKFKYTKHKILQQPGSHVDTQ